MSFVNKILVVGNIGKNPELRQLKDGRNVCSFSVATSEKWKDKQTGQSQERTEWHNVECFGKLADFSGKYAFSGSKIYVEGKVRTDNYIDASGVAKKRIRIIANDIQLLSRKNDLSSEPPEANGNVNIKSAAELSAAFDDDDIPF